MSPLGDDERAELASILRGIGVTDAVLEAVLADPKADVPVEMLFQRSATLSARDVARAAGVDLDRVLRTYHLAGIDIADPEAVQFSPAEADFCRLMTDLGAGFLPADDRDDLLRLIGTALSRIADGTVAAYVQAVEAPIHEAGGSVVDLYRSMAVGVGLVDQLRNGVAELLSHHLRVAVTRQRQAQSDVSTRLHYRYAVGFVDLVGFTALSRELGAGELAELIRAFEAKAFEVVSASGGRVVKHVGDEVMFTAPDAEAGCAVALALVGGFADDRIRPRAGLAYGDLVTRGGDHYGPVVNLASRLADEAVPDEVLVDASVADAVGDRFAVEPAGRRQLKGFDDPVPTWSVSPSRSAY